jgi:hypothetical protein
MVPRYLEGPKCKIPENTPGDWFSEAGSAGFKSKSESRNRQPDGRRTGSLSLEQKGNRNFHRLIAYSPCGYAYDRGMKYRGDSKRGPHCRGFVTFGNSGGSHGKRRDAVTFADLGELDNSTGKQGLVK